MKKNRTLILFLMLTMVMVNQCFAQTHNTIDLEVTQIHTLPDWYLQAQDNIMPDREKRYHRYSTDHASYLRIDSHNNNRFLLVERTKESLKLFFEPNSGEKIFVATCNLGIASTKWSYDDQYFCYQVITAANDDFILGSVHVGKVENNELTDHSRLIENISITDTCWDLTSERLVFADFRRLFIYFVKENKLCEIKPVWTDDPEGYPQRLDNFAFSPDGNSLIFRYLPSYWGDQSVHYEVKFPDK